MAKKAAPKAAPAKAAASAKSDKSDASTKANNADKATAPKPRAMTKANVYATLAERTELTRKEIASVFDALSELIQEELGKKGPGQFQIPGLLKLHVTRRPATKAKPGINPFTKEPMMIKAKPARNVVKARPLKALKDSV